jgi:hypothetical protein
MSFIATELQYNTIACSSLLSRLELGTSVPTLILVRYTFIVHERLRVIPHLVEIIFCSKNKPLTLEVDLFSYSICLCFGQQNRRYAGMLRIFNPFVFALRWFACTNASTTHDVFIHHNICGVFFRRYNTLL